ncbi:MAG: hypothetical protein WC783_00865 [Candidatus Paceibacterota bacterium]|jgi:hypothetical protein
MKYCKECYYFKKNKCCINPPIFFMWGLCKVKPDRQRCCGFLDKIQQEDEDSCCKDTAYNDNWADSKKYFDYGKTNNIYGKTHNIINLAVDDPEKGSLYAIWVSSDENPYWVVLNYDEIIEYRYGELMFAMNGDYELIQSNLWAVKLNLPIL